MELLSWRNKFCEAYQGRHGIIMDYPRAEISIKCGTKIVETLRSWIDQNRTKVSDDSSIQNIIDEIQGFNNQILYKLSLK